MLQTLKDLFDTFAASAGMPSPREREHALQLATAVLLVEVMRADPDIRPAERDAVLATLRTRFALADDELARLVELAEQTAQTAYDYHRFTASLNEHFTHAQKIQVVENMWQVAYADAHLDAHENHLISKIAGLLHVTHGEYIAAKLRAKESTGQA
ncbi:TerB family tellurite resistance protein [Polaromonas sp. SM01]|uniref:tellurite resistance TerB family protein n=1 Tax=Polaromonas sp. SM01 TaxID=3085630 RepID=UPI002981E7FF|nr:TerB family tellurite resistance protein [Polaromonas sp. SM01]MDW5443414.1 TerB family tellurite resistance protein [Polaromonas sp. SM01]